MLKLQFTDRRQPAMWLVDPRVTLGRDKSNSIVIDDEGVSVFHAEIRNEDGKVWLVDCGSINGTFLNDHRLTEKVELKAGDVVRLHTIYLEIIDPQQQTVPHISPKTSLAGKIEPIPVTPSWQIKALTGSISGRMFPITSTQIVGRDPSCDIAVVGSHVSRRHAEFTLRGGRLWVKDLGSSNGTFVNGKRAEESALSHGDEVKCDAMSFRVVGPQQPVDSEEDMEATMFRPAIQLPPAAAASSPAAASAPAPAVARASATASPASAPVSAPAAAPKPAPVAKPAAPASASKPATPPPQGMGLGAVVGIMIAVTAIAVGIAYVLFK